MDDFLLQFYFYPLYMDGSTRRRPLTFACKYKKPIYYSRKKHKVVKETRYSSHTNPSSHLAHICAT